MDFSEIKLTPSFSFDKSVANQLVDAITKGSEDRLPIYCAAFKVEPDYFWYSPLWLHREADWFVHFEVLKHSKGEKKGKWYLQLHFEHANKLSLEKLVEEKLHDDDPVKAVAIHARCEAMRQHLLNKLPIDAQPELYEWENWMRFPRWAHSPASCLTFLPKKDLETLEEALQTIPPFYQLIVASLRQDPPPVLKEMVGNIELS